MSFTYEGQEMYLPKPVRAAFIVELEDGSRVLYRFNEQAPITTQIDLEMSEYGIPSDDARYQSHIPEQRLTITGVFGSAESWYGEMPEYTPPPLEKLPDNRLEL